VLVISEKFTIVKLTADFLGYLYILPDPKYLTIYSINFISLSCWVILNLNSTRCPILFVDWVILASKFPSPVTNPAIQLGSGIFSVLMTGLSSGVNSLNSDFKKSDKPKFNDALILIILFNPSTTAEATVER
jgi:hypothetical protein